MAAFCASRVVVPVAPAKGGVRAKQVRLDSVSARAAPGFG